MIPSESVTVFNIKDGVSSHTSPEGTCLLGYRGSIAHNMYIPNSDPNSIDDVDLMGIVLGSKENYLGLREWGSRGTKEFKDGKYDCVYYEIRKAFSLLLQGNPNILSLLWIMPHHRLLVTPVGQRIINNRQVFVGRHVYNAFAGYAHAQLEKMELRDPEDLRKYLALTAEAKFRGIHPNHKREHFPEPERTTGELRDVANYADDRVLAGITHYLKKGDNIGYLGDKRKHLVLEHGYDAKNAAHCIRLLRMCKEFLATGEMAVYRPDAAELLDIKRGKWTLEQVKQHAMELFEEIKVVRDASPLPPNPDYAKAEALMVEILQEHLLVG